MQRISRFASTHVTAPIALHGIDGRYATALFTAASKNSELAKVEADLTRISALFAKDPAVQSFLENPLIDRASKKKGVDIIVELGKYSMLTNNFMHVLADNGRLALTKTILASFAKLMSASRGEVSITVTSAKELDAKATLKIKEILAKSKLIEAGDKLTITNKIDPEILGGLVIDMGEKTIDLSISSKINKLNNLLAQAV